MINCDTNTSTFSMVDDIFTLARDRGAAAAVLYSLTARSCSVNSEYLLNFEKPLDVFSSANLQGARLIESQFSNVVGSGYWFQSDLLNSSASTILNEINQTGYAAAMAPASTLSVAAPESTPDAAPSLFGESSNNTRFRRSLPHANAFELAVTNSNSVGAQKSNPSKSNNSTPVYLIATLANGNAISNSQQQSNINSNNNNNNNNGGGSSNTGLAMIILYAITGCVTLMFLIVIISGAIRAMRHPERYGPRTGGHPSDSDETDGEDANLGHQTRVAGLTRAILDTFPVVKFGRSILPMGSERVTEKKDSVIGPVDEESFMMQDCGQTCIESPNQSLNKHPVKIESTRSETGDDSVVLESLALSNLLSTQLEDQVKGNHSDTTIISPSNDDHQPSKIVPVNAILTSPKSNESSSLLPDKKESDGNDPHPIDGAMESSSTKAEKGADHLPAETVTEVSEMVGDVNNSVTCPICVCDFDDDDDIRVLPCDARHRFHQECVDPWLLNVSRFCPLCRWDLSTRKDGTKIAGEESSERTTEGSSENTNPNNGSSQLEGLGNLEDRRSTSSTTDRPTEAQIVANLRAMLQTSRQQNQSSSSNQSRSGLNNGGVSGPRESETENKSRFRKYLGQVREKTRVRRRQDS
ncbi:uncharacterized protein MELLADRAFT_79676 [Melampsora larici-populina 98AG31]|uniref:RING-type E3 ubiquitin transferase n=1 Tax=Melampsora larici-populina (strain 98AG31 / pathotype 3-4-7) TaxID=747676 RepID=F4S9Y4_MELLP|nr:uncharacterized protein MELLADRAFT_79676 [Melampsora larici-populina 98AG31]EGF98530.1 hypothetical protein MELLADRAFT_79676 [Melampsora larici-populina 98AG31]